MFFLAVVVTSLSYNFLSPLGINILKGPMLTIFLEDRFFFFFFPGEVTAQLAPSSDLSASQEMFFSTLVGLNVIRLLN